MKYFVIADKTRVDAFRLMGVDGVPVNDEREGDSALASALEDRGIGTVLLDKEIFRRNREKITAHASTGRFPLVVELS